MSQGWVLVGDDYGIPELTQFVPSGLVVGMVAASIRPQYLPVLREKADLLGVPLIIQPRATDEGARARFADAVRDLDATGLLCHSYSMLIPSRVLESYDGRAFNVHFSLLPRHRGPNPVQWALIAGDAETGVTLHRMSVEFDEGAVLAQASLPITDDDTWLTLMGRIRSKASELLAHAIPDLMEGRLVGALQDPTRVRRNPRIGPDSLPILFDTMSDREVFDLVRAQVSPLAGAWLNWDGRIERFPQPLALTDVKELRAAWNARVLKKGGRRD